MSGAYNTTSSSGISLTPTLQSLILTTANTEYNFTLPAITKKYSFQILSGGDCKYAFLAGKVAAPTLPYYVLKIGAEESEDFQSNYFNGGTIYFASATAGTIILIKYWN